jgi:hypothetical protein
LRFRADGAETGGAAEKGSIESADDRAEQREETSPGQNGGESGGGADPVEAALADALTKAAVAGQWSVVEVLTGELKARRGARTNVVSLDAELRRRER